MPREEPARKDTTQSSVSDTVERGVEKSQAGDPGVEEQEAGKPAVEQEAGKPAVEQEVGKPAEEQSAADAPESHEPDEHHPEKKQMKSEVPENEPTDVEPPLTEDSNTDTTDEFILPKKDLDTGNKVPEKEITTTTSASKTPKKKGKNKPSARKEPKADVEVTKGKTESAGKKQAKKRGSTVTEEKTLKKRIKLSAGDRNLPKGKTSAAPKGEKQVNDPKKVKKEAVKPATAVGKSSEKKAKKRKSDDKTRKETVTAAKIAKKKVKKDIGSQETKTKVEKTPEEKRPERSTDGSTVTSSPADPSTAKLKDVEAEGASVEGASAEGFSAEGSSAEATPTEGASAEATSAEGSASEATTAEGSAAEADGEVEKTSGPQMPREESEATEQEVVPLPGESDESHKGKEEAGGSTEGGSAEASDEGGKVSGLQLLWEHTQAELQEAAAQRDEGEPPNNQGKEEAGGSTEGGSAEASDEGGKVSGLQMLWEHTQAEIQEAAAQRDEGEPPNNQGEEEAGGSTEGGSAEASDEGGKVSGLQLLWEHTQAEIQEAAAQHDEGEPSNNQGEEEAGGTTEGGSAEASDEGGKVSGFSALQLLWEQTQAELQEAAAQRDKAEASTSQPVQPTPGREAGSGDESGFIAQLDGVSLVKIKSTTLYLEDEPIPVYFGDFSIPEIISSYDPNNVPMEEAANLDQAPEPDPGPQPEGNPEAETTDSKPPPELTAEDLSYAVLTLSDLTLDDLTSADLCAVERNNLPSTSRKESSAGGQERAPEWVVAAARAVLHEPRPSPARRHSI